MDQANLDRQVENIRATGGPRDAVRREAERSDAAGILQDLLQVGAAVFAIVVAAGIGNADPWMWVLIAIVVFVGAPFRVISGRRQRRKYAALVAEYDRRYGMPPPPPFRSAPPPPAVQPQSPPPPPSNFPPPPPS